MLLFGKDLDVVDYTFHDEYLTNSNNLHSTFVLAGGRSPCLPEKVMQIVGRRKILRAKYILSVLKMKTCFLILFILINCDQKMSKSILISILVIYSRPGIIWKAGSAVLTNVCFRENTHGIPTKGRMVV